ncbi:MAG: hypothetical protein KJ749_00735 [Planctomycetes bacterium]|nr:hypothetical protein [Planctomycetota bacterium]
MKSSSCGSLLGSALCLVLSWNVATLEAADCEGVSWPAGYQPVTDPLELPSDRLGLRGVIEFPQTVLPVIDTQALLDVDDARTSFYPRLRVGISRTLAGPLKGQWFGIAGGGQLWTAAVVAPGAFEVRLHFADVDLPPGAELYVYSPNDRAGAAGPYTAAGPQRSGEFWAAVVTGDTVNIECYTPDDTITTVPLRVDELGHRYRPLDCVAGRDTRSPLDCMGDVACYPDLEDVSYSVAKMEFYSNDPPDPPGWYNCTGQLLASENGDLTPYFLTSAHCVDEQYEGDSLALRWFYQRSSCGGSYMTSLYSYDADVLGTSGAMSGADWSLLMLKGVLPANVYWSGWMTGDPPSGDWAVGVHHPDGSWKRYSRGKRYSGGTYYHQIRFNVADAVGQIYYGSSGSGMWRESDQKLFGNCSHGYSEPGCDHMDTYAYYGRFASYYSSISSLLASGPDDGFEDNDACASAATLDVGDYDDLVVKSVDDDWYRVTVGGGEQLDLDLVFTDSYGNVDVELYDACGSPAIATAKSFTNNESLTYTNSGPTADFYVRVFLFDDTRNTYNMEFQTNADGTAPSPDPMNFAVSPYALGPNAISMTAAEATDAQTPPVEYYFDFVSGGPGGDDSGWQSTLDYSDAGLQAYTEYCYRVKARDSASPSNETSPSGTECVHTLPDPALVNPPAAASTYPNNQPKNRYVSFDANNPQPVALQVAMTASLYFPDATGLLGWVGEPDGNGVSRVVDSAYFSDSWPTVVQVADCEIVPAATYEFRATVDEIDFSGPLAVKTTPQPEPMWWADCAGALEGGVWAGPNGVVNFDDVSAAVQYFTSVATAPHLTWVDVEPEVPNAVLNFADIQQVVYAFQGSLYPFSDPALCP